MAEKKKCGCSKKKGKHEAPVKDEEKGEIRSDVLGSYTGTPLHGDKPVQDADDL